MTYAETELGVHSTHEAALEARQRLDTLFTEVATQRDVRRDVEHAIADRELELTTEEYGKHGLTMSVSAMERHLKMVLPQDEALRQLRSKHVTVVSDIEGLEYDIRLCEADIRIAVARLQELGGYLTYLAAIKTSRIHQANVRSGDTA